MTATLTPGYCRVEDCARPIRSRKHKLCSGHLARLYSGGSLDTPIQAQRPPGMTIEEVLEMFTDYSAGPEGCWVWTGSKNGVEGAHSADYGVLWWNGKTHKAHRFIWERHHGPIPEGLIVLHECDNPPCINPAHLRLGTFADNIHDALAKGRMRHGENHHRALATEGQVREIRDRWGAGESASSLAREFGLSHTATHKIVHHLTWKHVP